MHHRNSNGNKSFENRNDSKNEFRRRNGGGVEMTIEQLDGKGYQLTQLAKVTTIPNFFVLYGNESNAEILEKFDDNKFQLVSVRSSANVEDSNTASFAGIFETELNVTRDNLICAVQKIMDSTKDPRVIEYCKINGIDPATVKMRVVIQKMVDARVAGVCLTKHDKSDTVLIESCFGLGEYLVSGKVTPDTYKVNRNSFGIDYLMLNHQSIMLTLDGEKRVPFYIATAQKLSTEQIRQLAETCLEIEQKLGYKSADIEWAFEKDKLYILQVREFVGNK